MNIFDRLLNILFPPGEVLQKAKGLGVSGLLEKIRQASPIHHEYITAFFDYKDKFAKDLIWLLKYKGNKDVAHLFGLIIYDSLLEDISEKKLFGNTKTMLIIPVPMSKKHFRERGFNQTELLARAIMNTDNQNYFEFIPNTFRKIRETKRQTACLTRSSRLQNVYGSFGVHDVLKIKGRDILVLDDVTTTGATFTEIRRVLLEAGARDVLCVAVAH